MRRFLFFLFFISFSSAKLIAQQPVESLQKLRQKFPIEKAYLQLDRDQYKAGDTIWFKAYLSSDYYPDTISSVLYVELRSSAVKKGFSKVWPVLIGTASGQLELPDTLPTGNYILRAYSPTMLNSGEDFIFKKELFVKGKKSVLPLSQTANLSSTVSASPEIKFYPEGGNFVAGVSNTVAFEIKNVLGQPISVNGNIVNAKGEIQTAFSTFHDGRGLFEFTPLKDETYFATYSLGVNEFKQLLPAPLLSGIAITILPHPQGYFFDLRIGGDDSKMEPAYMIGQIQHQAVFKYNFSNGKKEFQGVLDTRQLRSGIMQVTIFNKQNLPIAERLCFVDNKEYQVPVQIQMDTLNFNPRTKNLLRVSIADTIQGSISVSVTDANYARFDAAQENIISHFLLSSDLRGRINNPAWYFSSEDDSLKTALDFVMMTNGWRRYNWQQIEKQALASPLNTDPSFITVAGRMNLKGTNKPLANKQLMAILTSGGKGKSMYLVQTDEKGNFKIDSLLFFGQARIYFLEAIGKKSQYIELKSQSDSIRAYTLNPILDDALEDLNVGTSLWNDTAAVNKAEGIMLEGITVKAIKKSPLEEVDDRYTSGMFSGMANRSIDLVNSEEVISDFSIFEYLQKTVPGIDLTTDGGPYGGEYQLFYRQGPSVSSMGPIPMIIYLNEIETDATVIANIPPGDIALVKLYSSFPGATGNGAGGVLAIYTKKGADISRASKGDVLNFKGFSIRKEFYSPDYRALQGSFVKEDRRITLQWIPNILLNHINPSIPIRFYNSDRTKKYRVIVEGMTNSGKLIFGEKIFSAEKK